MKVKSSPGVLGWFTQSEALQGKSPGLKKVAMEGAIIQARQWTREALRLPRLTARPPQGRGEREEPVMAAYASGDTAAVNVELDAVAA